MGRARLRVASLVALVMSAGSGTLGVSLPVAAAAPLPLQPGGLYGEWANGSAASGTVLTTCSPADFNGDAQPRQMHYEIEGPFRLQTGATDFGAVTGTYHETGWVTFGDSTASSHLESDINVPTRVVTQIDGDFTVTSASNVVIVTGYRQIIDTPVAEPDKVPAGTCAAMDGTAGLFGHTYWGGEHHEVRGWTQISADVTVGGNTHHEIGLAPLTIVQPSGTYTPAGGAPPGQPVEPAWSTFSTTVKASSIGTEARPAINLGPGTVTFGSVANLSSPAPKVAYVDNVGTAGLRLNTIQLSGGNGQLEVSFAACPPDLSLQPTQRCPLVVTFHPVQGPVTGKLVVVAMDPDHRGPDPAPIPAVRKVTVSGSSPIVDRTAPSVNSLAMNPQAGGGGTSVTFSGKVTDAGRVAGARFEIGPSADGFIRRNGTQLTLLGAPYTFTGLNFYQANNRSDVGCTGTNWADGSALASSLGQWGAGMQVIRAWFFQPLAQKKVGGNLVRDWSAFDHTLAAASSHGLKVIATLTDQAGECGDGGLNGFKPRSWYEDGYRNAVQPGLLETYRHWVREVVARYKNDPRIAFWQLVNEAEIRDSKDAPCPGNNYDEILKSFAANVSGLIKDIDANHLVSLGTQGDGQCAAEGSQYKRIHDVPTIDLCEYHDYTQSILAGGDDSNGFAVRLQQCTALGKPLFVGEAGIQPDRVGGTLADRAAVLLGKRTTEMDAGAVGFLAWNWWPEGLPSVTTLAIGRGDPALDALRQRPPDLAFAMQPVSPPFGGTSESVRATFQMPERGKYQVCLIGTDRYGNSNSSDGRACKTLTVRGRSQQITFARIPTAVPADSPITIDPAPMSTSGLPVTLTTTTPTVCQLSGLKITLLRLGQCSITARQGGDRVFADASLTRTFAVKRAQAITFPFPGTQSTTAPKVLLTAMASSGQPVTLTSTTRSVCDVSGSVLRLKMAGPCSITADQAGNSAWAPATATVSFTVVDTPLPFVQAHGTRLELGNSLFTFDGASVYHASSGGAQSPAQAIAMASRAGLNSIRLTDLFDQSGTKPGSPTDAASWRRIDELIARARGANMKVVLDLSSYRNFIVNGAKARNHWITNCERGGKRGPVNYTALDPYRNLPALVKGWHTFLTFVANRVNSFTSVKYRDDTAIAVISLAGEPQGFQTEECGKAAASAAELTNFYRRELADLASLDANHLRSSGGLLGAHDVNYIGVDGKAIFGLADNTLPSVHTHDDNPGTLPQDYQTPILGQYAVSRGKPWFTEEFGWKQVVGDANRARYFAFVWDEQVTYGSAGALFWNLGDELGGDSNDVGPQTPKTWQQVRAH